MRASPAWQTGRDVRDEEERVGEGPGGRLVVLRERIKVNVEMLFAGVGDHDIENVCTRVVDCECDGRSLEHVSVDGWHVTS